MMLKLGQPFVTGGARHWRPVWSATHFFSHRLPVQGKLAASPTRMQEIL